MIGIEPGYFWNEMNPDEMEAVLQSKRNEDQKIFRRSWEQTREICFHSFIAIQGNKKIKKPSDLFVFPWDSEAELIESNKRK